MSFEDLPDLGKIGKRIGKRLRDVLHPPVDDGPSNEERLAQRLRDSLRGLVYFDNFGEIDEWKAEDVDPVQQGNTPLLQRPASQIYDQNGPTSRILLCHDYSGGYHEWEGVRPPPIDEKPYSCRYFQFVEFFIYFSHKIVCVPPAAWINACHRNGVKVLGTFMVEGDGKAKSIERMLDQVDDEFVVARRLAAMAQAYGFDGWLLNIEAEFPYAVRHPISNLAAFVRSLKRCLGPNGIVIWYDAITKDNEVDYQNAVTWKNVNFALAADVFFTNYKWTHKELHKTMAVAEQHGIKPAEIYFGVDCWAQNNNMRGPPRVTYPPNGGGGTLTGLATHVLAQDGFSTAIFGPAWPYEHFSNPINTTLSTGAMSKTSNSIKSSELASLFTPGGLERQNVDSDAEKVEHSMWEGTCLPELLLCDCKGNPHHRSAYRNMPIMKSAREYPAGSSMFLETNFQQAFLPALCRDEDTLKVSHSYFQACDRASGSQGKMYWIPALGSQAPLPQLWQRQQKAADLKLLAELQVDGSPCLHVDLIAPMISDLSYSNQDPHLSPTFASLCLFKLDLTTGSGLTAEVRFQPCPSALPKLVVGFYTKAILQDSTTVEDAEYELSCGENHELQSLSFAVDKTQPNARIVEIGLYCKLNPDCQQSGGVLDLYSLTIRPKLDARNDYRVDDIRICHRKSGSNSERRVAWTWKGSKDHWPAGLPWSDMTGPFSVFSVVAKGEELGQAHCSEFPLRPLDFEKIGAGAVDFEIKGHLFGGGEVFSAPQTISLATDPVRHLERSLDQS